MWWVAPNWKRTKLAYDKDGHVKQRCCALAGITFHSQDSALFFFAVPELMSLMKFNLGIMEDRYGFTFPSEQGSGTNFPFTFAAARQRVSTWQPFLCCPAVQWFRQCKRLTVLGLPEIDFIRLQILVLKVKLGNAFSAARKFGFLCTR